MPIRSAVAFVSVWCVPLLAISFGCQKNLTPADGADLASESAVVKGAGATSEEDEPAVTATVSPAGGAKAWADNCMRCHNIRRPNLRSDREWAVIVHHMRVRANLTAAEHRSIVRFLQAAN